MDMTHGKLAEGADVEQNVFFSLYCLYRIIEVILRDNVMMKCE
jgi:hypothetical protein